LGLTNIPILGSFHGSDLFFFIFGNIPEQVSKNTLNIMSSIVSFTNNLDPNYANSGNVNWPKYDSVKKQMYRFKESGPDLITDTFRTDQTTFFANTPNFQL
jgi:acetylcholinesterase